MLDPAQPLFLQEAGLWLGFLVSLAIFSLLIGENFLARFTLHVLVGSALGYAAVLAWQVALKPMLIAPLMSDPAANVSLFFPLILGLIMAVAGLERVFRTRRSRGEPGTWRRVISLLGAVPVALVLGLGIAILTLGTIQGTLAPQSLRAAASGLDASGGAIDLLLGALMLLVTTGTLLHLRIKPNRDLVDQPAWVRSLLAGWMAIGKRGIWLASGVIFARLMASRFSLLIARIQFLADRLETTGLWKWLERLQ
jgi:hypothetical protein